MKRTFLMLRKYGLLASAMLRLSLVAMLVGLIFSTSAHAATTIPLTVTLSKPVNVVTTSGTPRIALDVGGVTRYASYASGTGTASLTFNYATQAGDVDLDGISVSSPIQLNGGAIADLQGNPMTNLTFTPPNTSTVKVNYPSLGMDFVADADGRYTLNGTPYNDLSSFLTATGGSFTRNSIGTYYDSTGTLQTATANTPRFDHDPVTNARKGILIEEGRTNLLLYSSNFASNWTLHGATIAASPVTAPNGSHAYRVTAKSGNYVYGIYGNNLTVAAGTYTVSFYAKYVNTQWVWVRGDFPQSTWAAFDIQNGVTGNKDAGVSTTSIVPVGNGWYRGTLTFASSGGGGNFNVVFQSGTSSTPTNGTIAYTGTEQFDIYGPQLEQGAFPTSYIPTTTAAVTRAADNLNIPTTSWFNSESGTIFFDAKRISTIGQTSNWHLAASSNELDSVSNPQGGYVRPIETAGGTNLVSNFVPTSTTSIKGAGAYDYTSGYSHAGSTNGSAAVSIVPSTRMSGATSLGVAKYSAFSYFGGTVSKFKYYPTRAPDAQLQLMTQ